MGYSPEVPDLSPEQFKRSGDSDDSASFLRAADYFRRGGGSREQAGGTLNLRGGYTISETLVIEQLGITLKGTGWGNSTHPTSGTWIKWNGIAGIPMVKFLQTFNAGLDNIRLIGKSSAKPSCALELADIGTGSFYGNFLNRVWIGHIFGYDSDVAIQFENGIIASGTINGDSNTFSHVRICGCDEVGVDIQNPNFSNTNWNGLFVTQCPIGVKVNLATLCGINWMFTHNTDTCLRLLNGSKVQVVELQVESSARLATFDDAYAIGYLLLRGGKFQCQTDKIAADGRVIDTGEARGWNIHLDGFGLQGVGGYAGPTSKIRAYHTGGGLTYGTLRITGSTNILPANLELGSLVAQNDFRNIIYEPVGAATQDPTPRQAWQGAYADVVDRSFRVFANDQLGEHKQRGGPFIVKKLSVPPLAAVVAQVGSGATTYSYKVTALTYDGETDPTSAVTCTNAAALGASNVNRVSWLAVRGANAYRVYGRTSGTELLLKTVTWDDLHNGATVLTVPPHWDDDGSLTPSGALPTANTTGNVTVENSLTLSQASGASGYLHPLLMGTYAMWVDSTGDLRIKSSAPTSDTDGTVVGSQS